MLLHQKIRKGDVEAAFAQADVVVSGNVHHLVARARLPAARSRIAYYEGDKLVVETAGQWLHEDRRQLAAMLGLAEDAVVVRYAKIGGAFGGREDFGPALLAWRPGS